MKTNFILSVITEIVLFVVTIILMLYVIATITRNNLIGNNSQIIIESLHFYIIIPVFLLFVFWFYKSYVSLKIDTGETHWKSYWAIIGWFIPILSLFIPYLIMKEIFIAKKIEKCTYKIWWAGFIFCFLLYSYLSVIQNLIDIRFITESVNASIFIVRPIFYLSLMFAFLLSGRIVRLFRT